MHGNYFNFLWTGESFINLHNTEYWETWFHTMMEKALIMRNWWSSRPVSPNISLQLSWPESTWSGMDNNMEMHDMGTSSPLWWAWQSLGFVADIFVARPFTVFTGFSHPFTGVWKVPEAAFLVFFNLMNRRGKRRSRAGFEVADCHYG